MCLIGLFACFGLDLTFSFFPFTFLLFLWFGLQPINSFFLICESVIISTFNVFDKIYLVDKELSCFNIIKFVSPNIGIFWHFGDKKKKLTVLPPSKETPHLKTKGRMGMKMDGGMDVFHEDLKTVHSSP